MVEVHFEECLAFYFPDLHALIDWTVEPKFLEQELQQISAESEVGNRRVDKLVEVHLNSGDDIWLLIHIEIQSTPEKAFAERMFVYHYRIFDRFGRHPVSLATLTDRNPKWHPTAYVATQVGNSQLRLDFNAVKLLDYTDESTLLASPNPFALVTLAQLAEIRAGKSNDRRYTTKLRLMRLLLRHGYDRKAIRSLLTFIDWILRLPKGLEQQIRLELSDPNEKQLMRYITSWEQSAREEGLERGLERGLEQGRQKQSLVIARKLLPLMNDEQISAITGLSLEEVQDLRNQTVVDS